ncbi:aminopeptidase [Haladaptatus sp. CMAA 1909]|uniref:aminopeptidase n=1 Tax=Haladaptatus sp. CMAA 1909 TaxID=3368986 RepID=UPI003754ACE0
MQKHAEVLVDHSVNIETGDNVLIQAPLIAEDLIVALHEQIGKRGANPMISMHSTRARQAFINSCNLVDFEVPDHKIACFEEADGIIVVSGELNTYNPVIWTLKRMLPIE